MLLADGNRWEGKLIGACQPVVGELVFNTSMTGYQEILTDPSYHRQIVVLTNPEIGNYGCHEEACESEIGHASGLVFRHVSPVFHHRAYHTSLHDYLAGKGATAISELDTRKLTHLIRDKGPQNAVIAPESLPLEEAQALLDATPSMQGASLAPEVSTKETRVTGSGSKHVVLLDFGIKEQTIRLLEARDCKVTRVPWNTSFETIAALNPDGIMLSNGPGDPAAVEGVPQVVAKLMETYPVMGICLGFQLMALALGAKTYKLPFGHRGGNHPVKAGNRVMITAQNHGFAVDVDSLDKDQVEITHTSLFDGSLEGFRLPGKPVFGVQFHPEAAPGPKDCENLFDQFVGNMGGKDAAQK